MTFQLPTSKKWRQALITVAVLSAILLTHVYYDDQLGVQTPYLRRLAPLARVLAYLFCPVQPLILPWASYHSLKGLEYPIIRKQWTFKTSIVLVCLSFAAKMGYAGLQVWGHAQGKRLDESVFLGEAWQAWEEMAALVLVLVSWKLGCRFDGGLTDRFLEWTAEELRLQEEKKRLKALEKSGYGSVAAEKV